MIVNVVISGLSWAGSLRLQVSGKNEAALSRVNHDVTRTLTALPEGSLLLFSHPRVLRLDVVIMLPGGEPAFVCTFMRCALP